MVKKPKSNHLVLHRATCYQDRNWNNVLKNSPWCFPLTTGYATYRKHDTICEYLLKLRLFLRLVIFFCYVWNKWLDWKKCLKQVNKGYRLVWEIYGSSQNWHCFQWYITFLNIFILKMSLHCFICLRNMEPFGVHDSLEVCPLIKTETL